MQHQTKTPHDDKDRISVGFVYNNSNRTLKCLGQVFENVAFYEIDTYLDKAIKSNSHNQRPIRTQPKPPVKTEKSEINRRTKPQNSKNSQTPSGSREKRKKHRSAEALKHQSAKTPKHPSRSSQKNSRGKAP